MILGPVGGVAFSRPLAVALVIGISGCSGDGSPPPAGESTTGRPVSVGAVYSGGARCLGNAHRKSFADPVDAFGPRR